MYLSKTRLAVLALAFAVTFGGIGAGVASAMQTHMLSARSYLTDALNNLQSAINDKAGHRVNAISLTKQAIEQVNLGIKAGAQ